jgi:addiction module HigA family antidote
MPARSAPPHPGDVLVRKFLGPRQVLQSEFARAIGINQPNLTAFIKGRRALTPWMAWAFATELRTSPEYWMQLQTDYDLWRARPRRVTPKRSRKPRHR